MMNTKDPNQKKEHPMVFENEYPCSVGYRPEPCPALTTFSYAPWPAILLYVFENDSVPVANMTTKSTATAAAKMPTKIVITRNRSADRTAASTQRATMVTAAVMKTASGFASVKSSAHD